MAELRRRILDAAIDLIVENGLEAISFREAARRAAERRRAVLALDRLRRADDGRADAGEEKTQTAVPAALDASRRAAAVDDDDSPNSDGWGSSSAVI